MKVVVAVLLGILLALAAGATVPVCPTEDSQNCLWTNHRTGLSYWNGPAAN